jgi:hypothetical protein
VNLSGISSARHDERTPEDAEIIRTLQFLAEEDRREMSRYTAGCS